MIECIRKLLFRRKFLPVLLEAWAGSAAALLLVFSVTREIPVGNIPATFVFLLQPPVLWAALCLSPAAVSARFRIVVREVLFTLALQGGIWITAWALALAFRAQEIVSTGYTVSWFNLLFLTAGFLSFLLYRLAFFAFIRWRSLTRRSLLWTLVNSHLIVVFTLIAITSLVARLSATTSPDKYEPSGQLAYLVLELVRGIIPWIGVTLILIIIVEMAFLPPTLLVSYLTSRRFVRRINALAAAMRRGDLDARVEPSGEDEVAQLQADFNRMAAQLQQERQKVDHLLKNQRDLAAVVSHELRTPITVIRAYVENNLMERSSALPGEVRRDLETVHHEILSLQSLVDDLFTLSRLDAQRLSMDCAWLDLAPVIQRVLAVYQPLAWKDKSIDLSARLPSDLPRIWADAGRLEQVLGNLAQNAIRHTPQGGVVLVTIECFPNQLEVSIIDSGEGISGEDLPHIWERFFRGSQGSAPGRTGIGLSLVKDLVEAMNGSVGVESRSGEGARFWFRLRVEPVK